MPCPKLSDAPPPVAAALAALGVLDDPGTPDWIAEVHAAARESLGAWLAVPGGPAAGDSLAEAVEVFIGELFERYSRTTARGRPDLRWANIRAYRWVLEAAAADVAAEMKRPDQPPTDTDRS